MAERLVVLSVPHLRRCDVTPGGLSSLEAVSARGGVVELEPPFPSTAAPSFATLMTGEAPSTHGIIGDTYYDRLIKRIASRPLPDSAVAAPKLWERLRSARPSSRSMLWFAPNTRGAAVELAAWADPDSDSGLLAGPAGLAEGLTRAFGPYPGRSGKPGCEAHRLARTSWIVRSAAAVIAGEAPDLAVIRVPYLGQIARRFGPDSRESCRAVRELDGVLAPFLDALPRSVLVVAVTESVVAPVSSPIFPNRTLRALGLLRLRPGAGGGLDADLERSAAFALADHQLCHVYLNDPSWAAPVASAFAGPAGEGVAHVAASEEQRRSLGLDHPRSGDIILVAESDRWFAPDWWSGPAERPRPGPGSSGLARATPGAETEASPVKGSLGAPPPSAEYRGIFIASDRRALPTEATGRPRSVTPALLDYLSGAR